jgi:hypothetical protein
MIDIVKRCSSWPVSADGELESLERLRRPSVPTAWLERTVEEHRQALYELQRQEGDPQFDHRIGSIRWHESQIRRRDRVLDERFRAAIDSRTPHPPEPPEPPEPARNAPANLRVIHPPASRETVLSKAERTAMLAAYKAECKTAGVKVGYREIGREVDPASTDPTTLVNKWRAGDPRYEGWTPRFLQMFADRPKRKQAPGAG